MKPVPLVELNTGHKMPSIGLGTAQAFCGESLNAALECGYRSLDTAYMYWNEECIGDVLQDWFTKGKLKREDVFVCSKLPAIANRSTDVYRFLSMSLKKLKLDYLDLYLIHHPFGFKHINDANVRSLPNLDPNLSYVEMMKVEGRPVMDDETDLESLWKGLEKEVKAGRVKSLGVSNFNSHQINKIMKIAEFPIAVNQVEIHPHLQQQKLVEFCQNLGIAVVAYSPLGSPYTAEGKELNVLSEPTILEISKKYGKSASQIVLRSLVQRKLIVIPKSSNPERIKSNLDILDFTLSEEDMKAIAKLDKGEKARIYHFKHVFKGCENHKEYPFHAEF